MQRNQQVVIKIMDPICELLITKHHSAIDADFVVGGNPFKREFFLTAVTTNIVI